MSNRAGQQKQIPACRTSAGRRRAGRGPAPARTVRNTRPASALPRDSCTAVTGSCTHVETEFILAGLHPCRWAIRVRRSRLHCPAGSWKCRRRLAAIPSAASSRSSAAKAAGPQRHGTGHGLLHVRVAGQGPYRLPDRASSSSASATVSVHRVSRLSAASSRYRRRAASTWSFLDRPR